jgi:hypothetical protein
MISLLILLPLLLLLCSFIHFNNKWIIKNIETINDIVINKCVLYIGTKYEYNYINFILSLIYICYDKSIYVIYIYKLCYMLYFIINKIKYYPDKYIYIYIYMNNLLSFIGLIILLFNPYFHILRIISGFILLSIEPYSNILLN